MHLAVSCIVTNNYVSDALALAESVKKTNNYTRVYVLVIGDIPKVALNQLENVIEWIPLDKILTLPEILVFTKKYNPFELCCALRGRFHLWLLDHCKDEKWVMLDGDMQVLGPLSTVSALLDEYDVILTAHSNKPVEFSKIVPHEIGLLNHGLYNGGFLAMRKSENSKAVATWLDSRLSEFGYSGRLRSIEQDVPKLNLFVDQLWLNLIPLYFKNIYISDDEVLNLGHWNLYQGKLSSDEHHYYFDGRPVLIAHYSSVPKHKAEFVSTHSNLYLETPLFIWKQMYNSYSLCHSKYRTLLGPIVYTYLDSHLSIIGRIKKSIRNILRIFS